MTVKEVCEIIETYAPLNYQESYDNSGLQTGNYNTTIKGILISIDITENVVDESIAKNCNMIIAHHPVIFKGLKKLTGSNDVERVVEKAIKNDIAIYAAHTNLDSTGAGVSIMMAEKIGLQQIKILEPKHNNLLKIVCFVPETHAENVRNAMFDAGAGNIGNYSSCSFNINGLGSFKGNSNTHPFAGKPNEMHYEKEIKIETIVRNHQLNRCIKAMMEAHPYEEVAYDVYSLQNQDYGAGMGAIGTLEKEITAKDFFKHIKETFACSHIKYSGSLIQRINKVAVCGGSGSFLIGKAIQAQADVFITGDIKYHDYFIQPSKLILADIGHYESEQFTKEIIINILMKKNPKFAVRFSDINTNPIKLF
jgi:dinuclear metal center YbgI/SA1388 family protein